MIKLTVALLLFASLVYCDTYAWTSPTTYPVSARNSYDVLESTATYGSKLFVSSKNCTCINSYDLNTYTWSSIKIPSSYQSPYSTLATHNYMAVYSSALQLSNNISVLNLATLVWKTVSFPTWTYRYNGPPGYGPPVKRVANTTGDVAYFLILSDPITYNFTDYKYKGNANVVTFNLNTLTWSSPITTLPLQDAFSLPDIYTSGRYFIFHYNNVNFNFSVYNMDTKATVHATHDGSPISIACSGDFCYFMDYVWVGQDAFMGVWIYQLSKGVFLPFSRMLSNVWRPVYPYIFNNYIIYAGGPGGEVDIYDTTKKTWSLTFLPTPRFGPIIGAVNGYVIFIGGDINVKGYPTNLAGQPSKYVDSLLITPGTSTTGVQTTGTTAGVSTGTTSTSTTGKVTTGTTGKVTTGKATTGTTGTTGKKSKFTAVEGGKEGNFSGNITNKW